MGRYIVTCPICKKRYGLPPCTPADLISRMFVCPNCKYTTEYTTLIKGLVAPPPQNPAPPTNPVMQPMGGPMGQPPMGGPMGQPPVGTPMGGPMGQPMANGGAKTKVAHAGGMNQQQPQPQQPQMVLHVLSDDTRIPLMPGNHTLGRRSSDSTATIQLAPDPYMSRVHATLFVTTVGGKVVSQIRNMKRENPIFVNGNPLHENKVQTLKVGDRLQIGMTNIVYTNK